MMEVSPPPHPALGTVHSREEVLTIRAGVVALKVDPPVRASRNLHRVVAAVEEEVENNDNKGNPHAAAAAPGVAPEMGEEEEEEGTTATSLPPPSTTTLGVTVQAAIGGTKVKREEVEERLSLHHVALSVRRRGREREGEEEEENMALGNGGERQVTVMDTVDALPAMVLILLLLLLP
jgi:hypothetical protein